MFLADRTNGRAYAVRTTAIKHTIKLLYVLLYVLLQLCEPHYATMLCPSAVCRLSVSL